MIDLLGLGSAGLRAYQSALDVVGDNIANANTEGYSRRDVLLRPNPATGAGYPLLKSLGSGTGVNVAAITRAYDAFKSEDARVAGGDYARVEAKQRWLTVIQQGMSDADAGLGTRLTGFFNAAQGLAADPSSSPTRIAFLDSAGALADQFHTLANGFAVTTDGIGEELGAELSRANAITAAIADLNDRARRTAPGTAQAAALLDERDGLVAELSTIVRVEVIDREYGQIEVRLGTSNGPAIVSGQTATAIGVRRDGASFEILVDPYGAATPARLIGGGAVAGLLDAAERTAKSAADLDALADRFVAAVNAQHRAGVDLNGAPGDDLFHAITLAATPAPANAGSSAVQVTLSDTATPFPGGYTAQYNGTAWVVSRADASASVTGTGTLTIDGVTLTLSGAPRDGDSYTIAAQTGAAAVKLRLTDPAKIAAADRWTVDRGVANGGTGAITFETAVTTALPAHPRYTLRMAAGNMIEILDPANNVLATQAYTAGAAIPINGFSVRITGAPDEGDSFTVASNIDGRSDNRNLLKLVGLRAPGQGGYELAFEKQVTAVASELATTKALAAATKAVRDNAEAANASASAVNLDEEAANLIRFQQAYQASAKIIAAARETFASILEIV